MKSKCTKVVIVEDDKLTADHMAMVLKQHGIQTVGITHKADKAIALIESHRPDLVLLDVQLNASIDGVQIASMLQLDYQIPFIYITSYSDQKTVSRISKTNPAGYLQKPFDELELIHLLKEIFQVKRVQQFDMPVAQPSDTGILFAKMGNAIESIKVDNIVFVEANGKYACVHSEGMKQLLNASFKEFKERLPASKFVQVHRSYLINIEKVSRIEQHEVWVQNRRLPIGQSFKKQLIERLRLS